MQAVHEQIPHTMEIKLETLIRNSRKTKVSYSQTNALAMSRKRTLETEEKEALARGLEIPGIPAALVARLWNAFHPESQVDDKQAQRARHKSQAPMRPLFERVFLPALDPTLPAEPLLVARLPQVYGACSPVLRAMGSSF